MKGERQRKTTTITVDPVDWAAFQENVKKFLPDPSASNHLGTLIKSENARFNGGEGVAPAVNEATLQRNLRTLAIKKLELKQLLEKQGVLDHLDDMVDEYNFSDSENDSDNHEALIGKLLHGIGKKGTPVNNYIENEGNETDVMLYINLIQVSDESRVVRHNLREVQKKRYSMPSPEEEKPEPTEEPKQTTLPPDEEEAAAEEEEPEEEEEPWDPELLNPRRPLVKADEEEE